MRRVIPVVVALLLGYAVLQLLDGAYTKRTQPTDIGTASPSVVPTADPPELVADKRAVDDRIRRFVAAYYRRDALMFAHGVGSADRRYRTKLSTHVTLDFLESSVTSLDIPQNHVFVDGAYRQIGRVKEYIVGGHIDDNEADRSVMVVVRTFENGTVIRAYASRVDFGLVKQSGTWKIVSCTCDM